MARKKSQSNGQATNGNGTADLDRIQFVSLSTETRRRYLNYALSVITSRALPDVRDGLKPVQRRILYVMFEELGLTAQAKARKCAKICGDTTGNYHPHGDMAVYDALARMAQDFSLRYPLINGQGNFGSVMGLPQAAPRYTEARLTAVAEQLMNELRYQTVDERPNYDATRNEPVVLPARFPNLLVNGTSGIAVGMATNIPPHNLGEVLKACVHLIRNPDASVPNLMKYIKGPDFPLGGKIVSDRESLKTAYKVGHGSVRVRGEWKFDTAGRKEDQTRIVIYSVPYGVTTGPLVAELGEIVNSRKLPQLLDANDETDDRHGLRVVLELKPGSDAEAVMAYVYKHTSLEQNFGINMTCLVPDEKGIMVPRRVSLVEMLQHFLDFRFITVKRRFEFQLRQLERRIHILEGFAILFNDLTRALKIIRESSGKQDAAEKLMKVFPLDEEQTYAILELQLYRISSLEINRILDELKEKRAEAKKIRDILASKEKLWKVIEEELEQLSSDFADPRRTKIGSSDDVVEYDPTAYIVRENANVVLTRDGWVKRVGKLQSVESTRVREGDAVLDVIPTNTGEQIVFFSSEGIAYTLPVDQVPPSTGYGEPLSKHVRLGDGTRILAAVTTDPRFTPEDKNVRNQPTPGPFLLIVTEMGQVMRYSFSPFRTPSTKAGRKYCRLKEGDKVAYVELVRDGDTMFIATQKARVLHFAIKEVPVLAGAGRGVRGIRLASDDKVLGAVQLSRPSDCLRVRNTNDKQVTFGQMKYGVTSRGGKGIKTSARSGFAEVLRPEIQLIDWSTFETK